MRLLLMGPPGAGKGTQAVALSTALGVPQIATGDIFRANVSAGTELGRTAQQYMDAGDYVPDSVTNAMVRARLAEPDAANGFLLDGYPRTVEQVKTLDDILAEHGTKLDAVVALQVPAEELVHRLVNRAHRDGRSDDTEDVIRHRQTVYADQTAPLLDEYSRRGILLEIDGIGEVEEVRARVMAALDAVRSAAVPTDNG
ncbi:MAG: Adenylate kinase [uncultured Nocardioidaceae bacterium]|uniref:Adenylate kinase n=1 Tax=uncultured Nocardioidaceae bacterium TaxID=253824 RepID=A0A6J4KRD0_9ACTN|nr:MAG: Adenylate kinase [uncultured Nocardioidaceae bacterium]CAA9353033.1 MAG: Adenylate kinase [uncultured Nocardioidaceae bacterium]